MGPSCVDLFAAKCPAVLMIMSADQPRWANQKHNRVRKYLPKNLAYSTLFLVGSSSCLSNLDVHRAEMVNKLKQEESISDVYNPVIPTDCIKRPFPHRWRFNGMEEVILYLTFPLKKTKRISSIVNQDYEVSGGLNYEYNFHA